MQDKVRQLIGSDEVAKILSISKSHAYKIIGELNKELANAGYLTIQGKVDSLYLENRYFPALDNTCTINK